MAGAGPKKRLEENKKRLQILQILVGLGFLAQAASLWLQGVSTWRLIGFAGTVLAAGGSYFGIASLASPVYDGNGTLIDGGADLDRGGMCGYLHDILYVSAFTQIMTPLSSYFWYTLLVIPIFAGYKASQYALPWIKSYWSGEDRGQPYMDEATRRKLEKTEKRAERRRMKWR